MTFSSSAVSVSENRLGNKFYKPAKIFGGGGGGWGGRVIFFFQTNFSQTLVSLLFGHKTMSAGLTIKQTDYLATFC